MMLVHPFPFEWHQQYHQNASYTSHEFLCISSTRWATGVSACFGKAARAAATALSTSAAERER